MAVTISGNFANIVMYLEIILLLLHFTPMVVTSFGV